ncbi:MAG TPA: hypothetical protein VFO94_19555, partial [Gammaproteobacteria bacterium]|nr:hypothetical protein [Gammaproteobacteria bacterium]
FGTGLLPILKSALEKIGMKTQGPLLYDPTAASYNSEADDIVKGNPDAYVILDFPANYAKIGSALLRTGRFNGRKLFVAGGWPSTIPSFIPTASLEGARGTVAGSRTGTKAAEAFDKLFGGVARYAEKLPGPVSAYAKVLDQISVSQFFTNMQALGDSRVGNNTRTPTGRQMKEVLDELDRQSRGGR